MGSQSPVPLHHDWNQPPHPQVASYRERGLGLLNLPQLTPPTHLALLSQGHDPPLLPDPNMVSEENVESGQGELGGARPQSSQALGTVAWQQQLSEHTSGPAKAPRAICPLSE